MDGRHFRSEHIPAEGWTRMDGTDSGDGRMHLFPTDAVGREYVAWLQRVHEAGKSVPFSGILSLVGTGADQRVGIRLLRDHPDEAHLRLSLDSVDGLAETEREEPDTES